jgi:hypothetical protein
VLCARAVELGDIFPPCAAAKLGSACSARQSVLALLKFACSKRVNFDTQTPNTLAPPPNAWVKAALPIFARSAVQSLLAAWAGVGVARAATGARANAIAARMISFRIDTSFVFLREDGAEAACWRAANRTLT